MDAGEMTARLVLKRKIVTADTMGGEVVTYQAVPPAISAKPVTGGSREFTVLRHRYTEIEMGFEIYYRTDVTADWRAEWRGQDYEILGPPIDVDARKASLLLACKTAHS
jgi:SPP1 family predicted phage head-tail adaptor